MASWHRIQNAAHGTATSRFGWMSSSQCSQAPKVPSWIRRRATRAFWSWLYSRSRLETASARSEAAWISSSRSALLSTAMPSRQRVRRSSSATRAVRIARNRCSSLLVIRWLPSCFAIGLEFGRNGSTAFQSGWYPVIRFLAFAIPDAH